MSNPLRRCLVPSLLGPVLCYTSGDALVTLGFLPQEEKLARQLERRFGAAAVRAAVEQTEESAGAPSARRLTRALDRWFSGELDALPSLPLDPGGTPFQQQVWRALREIPAGETRSYADLAHAVGRPRAVRAVAQANARNPISLAIPCHRVVGKDGELRGYAGGLDRKQWLLEHEARHARLVSSLT